MTQARPWTTPEAVAAVVRRRWDDGSLPTAYVRREAFPAIEVPIRGPTATQIGADLAAVQAWKRALERASREGATFDIVTKAVGGRAVGRNTLPVRAVIGTFEQAWRVLGVRGEIAALEEVVAATRAQNPVLVEWLARHPLRALELADQWPRVLGALRWLAGAGGQGRYLREIEAEGVDTKFVVRHRGVLADLLDLVVPAERLHSRFSRGEGFAQRYGFAAPPRLVRLRCAEGFAGLPDGVSELGWRLEELAALRVSVQRVLVVENEVTYLAAPVPAEGVVIWGAGYTAGRLGRLAWIRDAPRVTYSGDLDTHGFAILNGLRAQLPQVRSLLMDRETLLAHRERWGVESSPTRAQLIHLTAIEQELYRELVEDVYAPSLRLEQERLAWTWTEAAFERELEV